MTKNTQHKIFGYARISTKKQNIERQVRNIHSECKEAVIVRETYTGTTTTRPEFEKLLKVVKEGDTIIFDSVSRMSRNASEGFALYQELYNRGVNLVFLKEPHINTSTYRNALAKQTEIAQQINIDVHTGSNAIDTCMNKVIDALKTLILDIAKEQITQAFAQSEKEVEDLRQRTREGIETARRAGKQIGGHKAGVKMVIKKEAPVKALIRKHSKDFEGSLNDSEVIAIINATQGLHVARNTYYKYKRLLAQEILTELATA